MVERAPQTGKMCRGKDPPPPSSIDPARYLMLNGLLHSDAPVLQEKISCFSCNSKVPEAKDRVNRTADRCDRQGGPGYARGIASVLEGYISVESEMRSASFNFHGRGRRQAVDHCFASPIDHRTRSAMKRANGSISRSTLARSNAAR